MFNITPTRRYLKKALKLIKKNPNLEVKIDNFINQLADNPKYSSLKSTKLITQITAKFGVVGCTAICEFFGDTKVRIL